MSSRSAVNWLASASVMGWANFTNENALLTVDDLVNKSLELL